MDSLFLIFGLGGQEIFFVFVIVLLLFGGNKIPELMRGLGRVMKEFKDASKGESSDSEKIKSK